MMGEIIVNVVVNGRCISIEIDDDESDSEKDFNIDLVRLSL